MKNASDPMGIPTAPPPVGKRQLEKPVLAQESSVQKIYRPSDTRPLRDDVRAAEFGIRKYTSQRLILYTDLNPEIARPLPELIDRVYAAWIDYFGELPPNREGTPFQMTGYLIDQPDRFVAAGMLPDGPPMFRFGRHLGAEFWMNKMNSNYYRRHLLIHEATHCFMTFTLQQYSPRWYLEGMAEYFGTHRLHPDGSVTFGVMPETPEQFPGLGRIELIRQEMAQGRLTSLSQLGAYTGKDWDMPLPVPYAWSWAVCIFLEKHPRYQARFRELGQHLEAPDFLRFMNEHFTPDKDLLEAEWGEFTRRLVYGDDVAANAFVPWLDAPREFNAPVVIDVPAAQSWQSTGIQIHSDQTIQIRADGEVVLNQTPKPWISQPQGISVSYAAGYPLGQLLAAVLVPGNPRKSSSFEVIPVGRKGIIHSTQSGEVWLRVNDAANQLLNNTGSYQVTLSPGK